jgi:hypothetical protein
MSLTVNHNLTAHPRPDPQRSDARSTTSGDQPDAPNPTTGAPPADVFAPDSNAQNERSTTPFDAEQRGGTAAGGAAPAEQALKSPFKDAAAAETFAEDALQRVIAGPASEAVSALANHREPQHVLNLFR